MEQAVFTGPNPPLLLLLPGQRFPFTTWFGRDAAFFHPYTGCGRSARSKGTRGTRGDGGCSPNQRPNPSPSPHPTWMGTHRHVGLATPRHRVCVCGTPKTPRPHCRAPTHTPKTWVLPSLGAAGLRVLPSLGAGSCPTGSHVPHHRGEPEDAPLRVPLAAGPGAGAGGGGGPRGPEGTGGSASGQHCFPPSGWLGRRQLRRQGRWKQLLRLCCYLWRREIKRGKKKSPPDNKQPRKGGGCSDTPLCSVLRPAPSRHIPSRCQPEPPVSTMGFSGDWRRRGGDGCRGEPRGCPGTPPPPIPGTQRRGQGHARSDNARFAGGPCWVSGPAPHSRGLETRPGSGAGLGAAAKNPPPRVRDPPRRS